MKCRKGSWERALFAECYECLRPVLWNRKSRRGSRVTGDGWRGLAGLALCVGLFGTMGCSKAPETSVPESVAGKADVFPLMPYGALFSDGPREQPWVALTYDDGPGPGTTKVLEVLEKGQASATFFMLGRSVREHPGLAARIRDAGHLIGCHSDTHPNFNHVREGSRSERLRREIEACRETVVKETGHPVAFMRMPHGYSKDWVHQVAAEERMVLANWTFGCDWNGLSEEEMIREYRHHLHPGVILLLHDGGKRGDMAAKITQALLEEMKKKGLRAVRLDTLLGLETKKKTDAPGRH